MRQTTAAPAVAQMSDNSQSRTCLATSARVLAGGFRRRSGSTGTVLILSSDDTGNDDAGRLSFPASRSTSSNQSSIHDDIEPVRFSLSAESRTESWMTLVARAAVLVSFPVAAAIVGSLVALIRRPGPRLISGIQHFAAGVVMAALVGEVMPDLRREGHLPWAVGGFVIGVAVVLSLGAWGRRLESGERSVARAVGYVLPVGLLVAVGIDLVLDGLLVGLGITLGSSEGLILTIALTVEILFLSLSVVGELVDEGVPRSRAAVICIVLGLARISTQLVRRKGLGDFVVEGSVVEPWHDGVLG